MKKLSITQQIINDVLQYGSMYYEIGAYKSIKSSYPIKLAVKTGKVKIIASKLNFYNTGFEWVELEPVVETVQEVEAIETESAQEVAESFHEQELTTAEKAIQLKESLSEQKFEAGSPHFQNTNFIGSYMTMSTLFPSNKKETLPEPELSDVQILQEKLNELELIADKILEGSKLGAESDFNELSVLSKSLKSIQSKLCTIQVLNNSAKLKEQLLNSQFLR